MNEFVLIRWNTNWADEMDIEGYEIHKKSHYDVWAEHAVNHADSFEICIGTNEEIYYVNGQELLNDLTVISITDKEATTFRKLLGKSFGFTDGILCNHVVGN
jgi:hypothetical protein